MLYLELKLDFPTGAGKYHSVGAMAKALQPLCEFNVYAINSEVAKQYAAAGVDSVSVKVIIERNNIGGRYDALQISCANPENHAAVIRQVARLTRRMKVLNTAYAKGEPWHVDRWVNPMEVGVGVIHVASGKHTTRVVQNPSRCIAGRWQEQAVETCKNYILESLQAEALAQYPAPKPVPEPEPKPEPKVLEVILDAINVALASGQTPVGIQLGLLYYARLGKETDKVPNSQFDMDKNTVFGLPITIQVGAASPVIIRI